MPGKESSSALSRLGYGIAIGLAIIACTAIAAKTFLLIKSSQNTVQVKGYAERPIVSEKGTWSGQIHTTHANLTEAYKELDRNRRKTQEILLQEGFKPAVILWGSVERQELMKPTPDGKAETNEVERYVLTQTVEVNAGDVSKLTALRSKIDDLNLQGFDVSTKSIKFYYPSDKLDKLKVALLAEATKSARERADQFAVNSNCKLGKLMNARQGVFQVTALNSSDVGDYGTYDTEHVEKVVKIVVTMTYGIE